MISEEQRKEANTLQRFSLWRGLDPGLSARAGATQGCGNTGGIPDVPARRSPLAPLGKHLHFKSQRNIRSGRARRLAFLPGMRLHGSCEKCKAAERERPGIPRPASASEPGPSPGPTRYQAAPDPPARPRLGVRLGPPALAVTRRARRGAPRGRQPSLPRGTGVTSARQESHKSLTSQWMRPSCYIRFLASFFPGRSNKGSLNTIETQFPVDVTPASICITVLQNSVTYRRYEIIRISPNLKGDRVYYEYEHALWQFY